MSSIFELSIKSDKDLTYFFNDNFINLLEDDGRFINRIDDVKQYDITEDVNYQFKNKKIKLLSEEVNKKNSAIVYKRLENYLEKNKKEMDHLEVTNLIEMCIDYFPNDNADDIYSKCVAKINKM